MCESNWVPRPSFNVCMCWWMVSHIPNKQHLRHQLGVLQFKLILTVLLSRLRAPQFKGSVLQDCPLPFRSQSQALAYITCVSN